MSGPDLLRSLLLQHQRNIASMKMIPIVGLTQEAARTSIAIEMEDGLEIYTTLEWLRQHEDILMVCETLRSHDDGIYWVVCYSNNKVKGAFDRVSDFLDYQFRDCN